MDMIQYQIDMEKLFHKNQVIPRILQEFENEPLFAQAMDEAGIPQDFGFMFLVQMALHKRANLPTMVGILRSRMGGDSQATADMLLKCVEADLAHWVQTTEQFVVRFTITDDVQADLDRYQYPLPMVVPPRELTDNHSTGYYSSRNSVLLKDNHHDGDVCLDHLNQMNAIPLKLNHQVANMIKNRWRNLDKPKDGEDRKSFERRVKQFNKYDRTVKDVHQHIEVAGGTFHLTHKIDKRGRTYCQGYHTNYQGTPWNKAVVEFANEEVTQ